MNKRKIPIFGPQDKQPVQTIKNICPTDLIDIEEL